MAYNVVRIELNRPDLWINCRVSRSIFLFSSSGNFSSPYYKICIRTLFWRFVYPNVRSKAKTPVRRSLRDSAKEGQNNKKCSISSIPSLVGHFGFMVSLELCLNL